MGYLYGIANGADVPVDEKVKARADATFPEFMDRRAAEQFGSASMEPLRQTWRDGLIDLAWDDVRRDVAVMPIGDDGVMRLARAVAMGGGPGR